MNAISDKKTSGSTRTTSIDGQQGKWWGCLEVVAEGHGDPADDEAGVVEEKAVHSLDFQPSTECLKSKSRHGQVDKDIFDLILNTMMTLINPDLRQ